MEKLKPVDMPDSAFWPDWQPPGRLAVPVRLHGRLLGLVFVDADAHQARNFADEKTQEALARHMEAGLAAADRLAPLMSPYRGDGTQASAPPIESGLRVRRIGSNSSIFIDGHYLIKGVAAAILWKLLTEYVSTGRTEFSTREMRLEPSLQLPDVNDNFSQRFIMLQRRLESHGPAIRIEKTGRGLFRLVVQKALTLVEG